MSKNFWTDKKVIVTGAGGFVGSHLVTHLISSGANVTGIVRQGRIGPNMKQVDVLDYKNLEKIFLSKSVYACIHLAGESLVEMGQQAPYNTFQKTINSALNILELCRVYKVKRIIVASTAHVYGDTSLPFKEEDPPRPSRPYETSKTCMDLIAQSYADTYHLPVLIPRFVNIYGPGDLHFSRIIPKTIQFALKGISPPMWGGGNMREYLYIDDVVRAYDLLVQISDTRMEKNRIYNFGTGKPISVRELMRTVISISGKNIRITSIPDGRSDELKAQQVSWEKAKRVLGWKPEVTLDVGLRRTLEWYRQHL